MPLKAIRAMAEIAELAREAPSEVAFRASVLEKLQRLIGFERGSLVWTSPYGHWSAVSLESDPRQLSESLNDWIHYRHDSEHTRRMLLRATVDREIFDASYRDRSSMYREYFAPHRMREWLSRVWLGPDRISAVELQRCGHHGKAYDEHEIAIFEMLLPVLSAGEALWTKPRDTLEAVIQRNVTELFPKREAEVITLVLRGLTNPEIASILGVSSLTIRNLLSRSFKRVGVASRTELIYTLADDGSRSDSKAVPKPKTRPINPYWHLLSKAMSRVDSHSDADSKSNSWVRTRPAGRPKPTGVARTTSWVFEQP